MGVSFFMKKYLILVMSYLLLSISPACYAFMEEKIIVFPNKNITTNDIYKGLDVIVANEYLFDSGMFVEKGSIIRGIIMDIKQQKRGKRDAYIVFKPEYYTIPSEKKYKSLVGEKIFAKSEEYKGDINKAEIASDVGLALAGLKIPYISEAVGFVKGFANPNNENSRFVSGVKSAYDASFLSYIKEGDKLEIKKDSPIILRFYGDNSKTANKYFLKYYELYKNE